MKDVEAEAEDESGAAVWRQCRGGCRHAEAGRRRGGKTVEGMR